MTAGFAELVCATNYSFLRGASHPADMVARALELGLAGIGIADRNTVAGVVRAHIALRDAHKAAAEIGAPPPALRLLVGARLVFADGTPDIIAYPATRHGWGRLTRLLTTGNLRAAKGDCVLHLPDLLEFCDDLLLIVMASPGDAPLLGTLGQAAPGRVWIGVTMPRRGADRRRLARLMRLSADTGVPLLATNDALYAEPAQRPLHDVLTCIGAGTTIAEAGRLLEANAERHIKPADEMARLFADCPDAIAQTLRLMERVTFTLDDLRYQYPLEPVPEGWEPQAWLEHMVLEAARERYGEELPKKVRDLLDEEFTLIAKQRYACYFLTVHDLVRFARSREPPILCQGRGSAANSIVCFLLGVTSVDPVTHDLLFSRFVSEERAEPPDIDVDFEHERREEVMQYIYQRYGRHRAGIAATVIHYRPRSAVREVGKVLGFSEDVTARLSSTIWGSFSSSMAEQRYAEAGFDIDNPDIVRLRDLVDQILHFPRHLSQHVGGFVLTEDRLDETVPIHNAAMEDRTFIEWDKDDIDALGLMKVDVLALGMLTCIRKAFALMREHGLGEHDLTVDLDADDPEVYDMLCRGDSIGVFQVESRAQMNMLPRLRPRCLYDLTVQVAIVRPGPIEGDMVHPYLRRRSGIEPVEYPSPAPPHPADELKNLLGQTYGVPLFQEQAMKLAIVAADFTPSEANQLRRAMATFRNVGTMHNFRTKLVEGMTARGYAAEFAERCFKQIEGFGSYGFPESHALSFARLVYVSSWIKCHHPAVFACALLNSQPMGFYAPAQIVRDVREHQVEVRPIDINASHWDNRLERDLRGRLALRLGFRQMDGFRQAWAEALVQARREGGRFVSIERLARRADLPSAALRLLADADAFGSLGLSRRQALWEVRRTPSGELPLFAAAKARELGAEPDMQLPQMPAAEEVVTDYQVLRLSLKDHPMAFLRARLREEGVLSCEDTTNAKAGAAVRTAGVVLVRQRPGKGNAIFVTIEDETGITNVVLWARLFERYRRAVMASRLMQVEGVLQRSPEGVVHLMANRVVDRTDLLATLTEARGDGALTPPLARADEVVRPVPSRHPRDARVLPKSRDFH
ncbi:MAG: error-prone DNA polymerase [Sphingomonadales bacterium RIFCSPHIGHO2_01_FULL_65_20]|uniref:error-prone DNA polymerase n=1 Tax=unclassified Blastomonas TaxID=2626550 RepID=UPI00082F3678|nr:error-prone DNA polymerase [Blastomonas sp.]MCH2237947.1 error-prone DNA polymerase [Blastomonas sp.]OHC95611.1 MAG: error-prone DNA polymerase [Sphingomonadales bacterium RIFCSPHIGHO2_01_FULL_65_20]